MATYKDIVHVKKIEGRDKPVYQKCGVLKEEDGKVSIKIDYIPSNGWNGWFSVFEQKAQDGQAKSGRAPSKQESDDDDPPF